MSKRNHNFTRKKNDKYFTPYAPAIPALLPYLPPNTEFIEPCAGRGDIIDGLSRHGHRCIDAFDISPQRDDIRVGDATTEIAKKPAIFITNPPWTRELLHPIIDNLRRQRATWLLFDADWAHTVQDNLAKRIGCKTVPELMEYCAKKVSVGRISWEQNGTSSLDNCAWYLFTPYKTETIFHARKK